MQQAPRVKLVPLGLRVIVVRRALPVRMVPQASCVGHQVCRGQRVIPVTEVTRATAVLLAQPVCVARMGKAVPLAQQVLEVRRVFKGRKVLKAPLATSVLLARRETKETPDQVVPMVGLATRALAATRERLVTSVIKVLLDPKACRVTPVPSVRKVALV